MNAARPWHAVALGEAEAPEVRGLFAEVFGQPMSDGLWRWKYAHGRGLATGTRSQEGRLLAHYGGTGRTLRLAGQDWPAVQLGDVMVIDHARGVLSRNGPFATAANAFLKQLEGPEAPFALGFGFPSMRHARLGEALGLYATVGEVLALEWPSQGLPATFPWWSRRWATAPLDWTDPQTPGRLDALAQALRNDAQEYVLPHRDAPWWRHRFADHPDTPYRAWWVRHRVTRRTLGAVVLRPGAVAGAAWEVLDWIGPIRHMHTTMVAARAIAASAGAQALTGWFSAPVARQLLAAPSLADARSELACANCVTVARAPSLTLEMLHRPWWLTGGDTDFR